MAADRRCGPCPGSCSSARRSRSSALIARRGRATPWPTLAWLGVFFVIGAYAIRGVAWWPLAAVCGHRRRARDEPGRRDRRGQSRSGRPLLRRLNVVHRRRDRRRRDRAAAGLATDRSRACRRRRASSARRRPASPARFATLARPGDRVFNPQPWGSWFEFALPDLLGRHRLADRDLPDQRLGRLQRGRRRRRRLAGTSSPTWRRRSSSSRPRTRPSPDGSAPPAGGPSTRMRTARWSVAPDAGARPGLRPPVGALGTPRLRTFGGR